MQNRRKVPGVNLSKNIKIKIIDFLSNKDDPVKAFHISKGIGESPQITCYHVKQMVEMGLLLPIEKNNVILYGLQAPFYAQDAEDALIISLIPFVEAFASTIVADDNEDSVVYENLRHYLRIWIERLKKDLDIGTNPSK